LKTLALHQRRVMIPAKSIDQLSMKRMNPMMNPMMNLMKMNPLRIQQQGLRLDHHHCWVMIPTKSIDQMTMKRMNPMNLMKMNPMMNLMKMNPLNFQLQGLRLDHHHC
jgi:hypothetical protein